MVEQIAAFTHTDADGKVWTLYTDTITLGEIYSLVRNGDSIPEHSIPAGVPEGYKIIINESKDGRLQGRLRFHFTQRD